MPDSSNSPATREPRLVTGTFVLIVASGLAYFLGLAMLNPVIPVYVDGPLSGGGVAVGVGVGAFAFGAVLLRPFAGRIGDRVGRRVLLIGGALLVAAATACYGLVTALWWLTAARFVAGIGEAAFFVGAATMITDIAPEARRGEAVSYWSVAVYGGLAFGPFLGEVVMGPKHHERFALAWGISAGLALLAAVIGLFTREVAVHHAPPTGRQHLLHRHAIGPGAVLFLGLVALAGWASFVKLYARDVLHEDEVRNVFLLYGITILVIRIVGARLPDRLGARRSCSAALVLACIGMATIAAWPTMTALYVGTAVFAVGMSLMYPALLVMALDGVPANERGSVVGTFSSFFDLSQGLGAAICGAINGAFGYSAMFWSGAALAVVGLVVMRSISGTDGARKSTRSP